RPADYEVRRTNDLGRELEDVITNFRKMTDKELPAINSGLQKKKLEPIKVLSEADWQKQHEEEGAGAKAGALRPEAD
ncbi:MAG TPA: hypothetical protein VGU64_17305, partial [Terriglobales bacterium]|nr:hypothetical protein [Terriglobales bacterium]